MKNCYAKIKFRGLLVLMLCLLTFTVSAQTLESKTITGTVSEASTGKPLVGARVQAYNNTRFVAMTDGEGRYILEIPVYVNALTVTLDGYALRHMALKGQTSDVDLVLYSENFVPVLSPLTNVQNAGSAERFDLSSAISIESEIQSQLGAEVRTVSRSGIPGAGSVMFVGGYNSLNVNAQPLIVLDDVILDQQYGRDLLHEGYYNNILSNLSVNDIESVTVLKSGTSLYGAKGANGVLIIKTKRNKSMVTRIDACASAGVEFIPRLPRMMNAAQYRAYASELLGTTDTKLTEFKFLKEDPDYYYYNQYHNETNWSDYVYREALTQNYSFGVQGGDEVAKYNLSIGYVNAQSTLNYNDFDRLNLRFNSDISISDKLSALFDCSFSNVTRNLRDDGVMPPEESNVFSPGFLSLIKSPFLSPYQYDTNKNLSNFLSDADDYLNEVLGSRASLANPLYIFENGEARNKNYFENSLINLAIRPAYSFNKNLSVKGHFNYTLVNTNENYYIPMTGVPKIIIPNVGTAENLRKSLYSSQISLFADLRMLWQKKRGANDTRLMAGGRYMNDDFSGNTQMGYDTGNDKTPNMNANLNFKKVDGAEDVWRSLSYYANLDYNYAEKYYLHAGLSMETSSRFGREVQGGIRMGGVSWGLFPSAAAAWVLSSEDWFRLRSVDYLKLNLAYDISGNDDIDYYAARTYFGSSVFMDRVTGLTIQNIGNTSIQWESTQKGGAGLEASLFQERVGIQLNAFLAKTDNLLTLKKLPSVTGLDYNWSNEGSLTNRGFDLALNFKLVNRNKFNWGMGFSLGHYKNEITALPDDESFITKLYGAEILSEKGRPAGLFYGYQTKGVYASSEEAAADGLYILSKTGSKVYFGAGDVIFVNNRDDSKEINADDKVVIGDPNPDLYGNIFSNIHYGRFSLDLILNYSLGNDAYNYQRSQLESGSKFYNQSLALLNRWTNEDQKTTIPRISYLDEIGNSRFSDRWIEDASYLRLKTVRLSYSLPLNTTFLNGLTLWASGNNLWTLTRYLGSDPEFSSGNAVLCQGIDRGTLAFGPSVVLGIKLNL